ncbi:MAG: lipocalin-like domain-containing protein [Exilibacterium sp.]
MITAKSFVGVWQLLDVKSDDGQGNPLIITNRGRMFFSDNGYFSASSTQENRKRFSCLNFSDVSNEEIRTAFETYVASYGTYQVDLPNKLLILNMEAALHPDWVGTQQIREYDFDRQGNLHLRISASSITHPSAFAVLSWGKIDE